MASSPSSPGAQSQRKQIYEDHVERLLQCRKCPGMQGKPVHGCVRSSRIISLGQAPGIHEERFGKPFAYTAGKTLFKWFERIGIQEPDFRKKVNMSAVCRCFPGKAASGDRRPAREEVENCMEYLEFEVLYHRPELIIPIGKLAIDQLLERPVMEAASYPTGSGTAKGAGSTSSASVASAASAEAAEAAVRGSIPSFVNGKGKARYTLDSVIGRLFRSQWLGHTFDWIALPHPSGLNVWNHSDTGKACIQASLALLKNHPAMQKSFPGIQRNQN